MKPKQNVQREINRTPDAFMRKRQLQIWKEKSVVNIHLKKLETRTFSMQPPRVITNKKPFTLNVCRRSFI